MNANATALEHIRSAINTADALDIQASEVMIADLKLLLQMAERAVQYEPGLLSERSGFQTTVPMGYGSGGAGN